MVGTTLTVRLLTGLLGASVALVLVFGVWPAVLGPAGLDLGHGEVPMAAPQPLPHLTVQPDAEFHERWGTTTTTSQEIFPWKDFPNTGTSDAVTGLPPVELRMTTSMELTFWAPTWVDRLGFAGPELATQAVILLVLWLLWCIVRTIPDGQVFTSANARRMAGIGAAVAVGGSVVQLVSYTMHKTIVARSAAANVVDVVFSFSFLPLVLGVVFLLLAEVFRQGVRLRSEVDGLV
jgi:hypothetical protein